MKFNIKEFDRLIKKEKDERNKAERLEDEIAKDEAALEVKRAMLSKIKRPPFLISEAMKYAGDYAYGEPKSTKSKVQAGKK